MLYESFIQQFSLFAHDTASFCLFGQLPLSAAVNAAAAAAAAADTAAVGYLQSGSVCVNG
jgi:hypothetical protein